MKKTLHKILQTGIVVAAAFCFTNAAHAQTWTAPSGAAPSGNVAAPINIGINSQYKTGPLGIGESTSTTTGTSTGYTFEVNGPTASNGLATFGDAYLTQFTHLGPVPTTTTYTGATHVNLNSAVAAPASFGFSLPQNSSTGIAGLFDTIGSTFAGIFKPDTAMANVDGGLLGIGAPYVPDPVNYGPCYGAFCNSEQYCDTVSQSCVGISTGSNGGTTNGWADGANSSTASYTAHTFPQLDAVLSLSPVTSGSTPVLTKTISTGDSETLYWTVTGAASCAITSANQTNNYNLPAGSGTGYFNISSNGFAHGYHVINFSGALPGNYTYTLGCTPSGLSISGSSFTTSVTLTIGNKLTLQVNGNSQVQGYIMADGVVSTNAGFVEQGSRVCLQNGTNCPVNGMIDQNNQGGSLELGGNNLVDSSGQTPYIDFHYGGSSASTQDYNMRIINGSDEHLDFQYPGGNEILWIDQNGLHLQSGKHIYTSSGVLSGT